MLITIKNYEGDIDYELLYIRGALLHRLTQAEAKLAGVMEQCFGAFF